METMIGLLKSHFTGTSTFTSTKGEQWILHDVTECDAGEYTCRDSLGHLWILIDYEDSAELIAKT